MSHARDLTRDEYGHGCFALDTQGYVRAFHHTIRDELVARGALYQDADSVWHLRWDSFDLPAHGYQDLAICDFCSQRPVVWLIPCPAFELPAIRWRGVVAPPGWSEANWNACEPCGQLVADRNRHALLTRARHHAPPEVAQGPPALRRARAAMLDDLHYRFWQAYRGGATRLDPHPFGH